MHGMESPQGGTIRIALRASSRHGERPHLLVGLSRIDGTAIFGTGTEIDGIVAWPIGSSGQVGAQLVLEDVRLQPGDYRLRAHAMDPEALRVFDTVERTFRVGGASREFGLLRLPHRWEAP